MDRRTARELSELRTSLVCFGPAAVLVHPSGSRKGRLFGLGLISPVRALLLDAPVLVPDEVISNLDSVSEQLLLPGPVAYFQSRTVVLGSHPSPTPHHMDQRVMPSGGRVVTERDLGSAPRVARVIRVAGASVSERIR